MLLCAQDARLTQLEWLHNEVTARYDPLTGRAADGAWPEITRLFNAKYGTDKTVAYLTKWYSGNKQAVTELEVTSGSLTQQELDWLVQTADSRIDVTGKMPRGEWNRIAADFKEVFGATRTAQSLRMVYTRARMV